MTMPRAQTEASIDITAPVGTVYTYLADFPRHIEWNEQPQQMTPLTEGPLRVGSRYQTREDLPKDLPFKEKLMIMTVMPVMKLIHGMSDDTVAEITVLQPNERIAWEAHLPSKRSGEMMRMHWAIDIDATETGTRVTQRCEVRPPQSSPFARMVNDGMLENLRTGIEGNLSNLKGILESAPAFA